MRILRERIKDATVTVEERIDMMLIPGDAPDKTELFTVNCSRQYNQRNVLVTERDTTTRNKLGGHTKEPFPLRSA
jgi:hypothetical protein